MGNRSRRTLHDLYVLGQTVAIAVPEEQRDKPEEPEFVVLWVQKLDPLDQDKVVRKAKAARARRRAVLADHEGDDYMALVDMVDNMSSDQRVEVITAEERAQLDASSRSEMELGEDSEWAKDGYLQGLLDEWADGLADRFVADGDDPDAKRVLAELNRFEEEVAAALKPQLQDLREMHGQLPPEELRTKTLEQVVDDEIQGAFINEYLATQCWLSARQACAHCLHEENGVPAPLKHQDRHSEYYFGTRDDIDRLDRVILGRLQQAYLELSVDPTEGKGSRAMRDSSESSEQPEPVETEPSSGQLAAVG